MNKAQLQPYMREGLDILFVGLNPAKGSSENRHYFSVNQAFWNQLYDSGLIIESVPKDCGDIEVFGSQSKNYKGWSYGITDLVTEIAESDSNKVKVTEYDCRRLCESIEKYRPTTVILLHSKVNNHLLKYLGKPVPRTNKGKLGCIIDGCPSMFYTIAFPHGNSISSIVKVEKYIEVRRYVEKYKDGTLVDNEGITKTLIINGSPRAKGDTKTMINTLIKHLDGECTVVNTYYDHISPCVYCRYCWKRDGCSINDDMQDIYNLLHEVDHVVIASPIYFSELTGKMLSFASRLQRFFAQRVICKVEDYKLKPKNGAILLVGGGDGSPDPAEDRAHIILHQVNAKSIGTVTSLSTNVKPVSEDVEALRGVIAIANQLNERARSGKYEGTWSRKN